MKNVNHIALLLLVTATLAVAGCNSRKATTDEIINRDASIAAGTLPDNPLGWRPITSFSNRDAHTMGTLYGNDVAIAAARGGGAYGSGAVLALVTWSSREDPHWFGGNIPSKPLSVEYLRAAGGPGAAPWTYSRYEGSPLRQVQVTPEIAAQRVQWLSTQKAAYMP